MSSSVSWGSIHEHRRAPVREGQRPSMRLPMGGVMGSLEKRLEDIVEALSPEEKARLVIENLFREQPALSPS